MLSLIVPVYNEEEKLAGNIKRLMEELDGYGQDFEIIIGEDGSADGTYSLARMLESAHDSIRVSHSDGRLGKGLAIKRALPFTSGGRICYLDIDLSSDISALRKMFSLLGAYDIVIGFRLARRSLARRDRKRYLFSLMYNLIIRLLFRSKVRDHQCGFKAFRRSVILDLAGRATNNRWFFDTEILVIAQKLGYSIKEMPVAWTESGNTKIRVNTVVIQMLLDITRSFSRLRYVACKQ